MPGSRRPITLSQVAQSAGVSVATVSYVLNNKPGGRIPAETQARIRTIASQLGYTPNVAAQALRTGKSRVVLVIIPHLPINFTMGEMITEFGTQLDAHGYVASMLTTGARKMDLAATVNATAPAAAISLVELSDAEHALLKSRAIACIETGFSSMEPGLSWSRVLQHDLITRQFRHLYDLGHRTIAWAEPEDPRLLGLAALRRNWAREAARELGIQEPDVRAFPLRADAADRAVEAWMANGVTAVAAYNDLWGMSVLEAARRKHLDVPDEFAVIGIDNIPLTEIVSPPLTSVSIDMPEYVRLLTVELMAMINRTPVPVPDTSNAVKFVRRGST